jgi:carbapenam-3-carboxylate synthase
MLYSFIATRDDSRDPLVRLADTLREPYDLLQAGAWNLLVKRWTETSIDQYVSSDIQRTHFLVGHVTNLEDLRSIAAIHSSEALTARPVEVLSLLHRFLGDEAFALVEGAFNFLTISADGALSIASDALGMQPAHIVFGNTPWVTSELKMLGAIAPDIFDFEPDDSVAATHDHADDYTPIRNARRVKGGTITTLRFDGADRPYLTQRPYLVMGLAAAQLLKGKVAKARIHELLSTSVRRSLDGDGNPTAVPLSGGLDSSLVTALARRAGGAVSSYAIGTTTSNEFPFSKIVSEHVGTAHTEYVFDDKAILSGVDAAIYLNEIFDGLSAEIQAGLMCLYKSVQGRHRQIITGYGADLLFGGVLKMGSDLSDVNLNLWRQVYRTRWTGEFAPFGAARYGLRVVHPFWTPQLMGLALSLDPALKVTETIVKPILREYAEDYGLLPQKIVWREKIGIHEGSSVNSIFADAVGVSRTDYAAKTRYAYARFKTFITNRDAPEGI